MNTEKNVVGPVLLALVSGAAIGATLGILFAPNKGIVTRKKIVRRGRYAANAIKEKVEDLKDSVEELIDEVEDKFTFKKAGKDTSN